MAKLTTIVVLIPLFGVGLYFFREYMQGGKCLSTARLDGKVVIITGANTGLGKEHAVDHVERGARVILACRSEVRGQAAAEDIKRRTGADDSKVKFMKLDLASLKSIRKFVEDFKQSENRLDILVNNAGMWSPEFTRTEDGFERTFGVNHLGHFLLTNLLVDVLKKSAPSRIVNVAGALHYLLNGINFDDLMGEKSYSGWYATIHTKLANIMFTRELAKRLKGTGVTTYSLHPGVIMTDFLRQYTENLYVNIIMHTITWPFYKSMRAGIQTQVCCSVDPALDGSNGAYYEDCMEKEMSKPAQVDADCERLWDISAQLVGLKPEDMPI